jgi:molybdopterin-binding protein
MMIGESEREVKHENHSTECFGWKIIHPFPGLMNTEITIELPAGVGIVSIITKTSAENLGLAKGKEVYAIIKASNVMVALD